MKIALIILALSVVVMTALPLLRFNQWWIRILDFPRGQIAIAGVLVSGASPFFLDFSNRYEAALLGVLLLAVGHQVMKIFPYTRLKRKQVFPAQSCSGTKSLSLLVANVLMDNRQSESFLEVVRMYDPDVILTVETDQWWQQALLALEESHPYTLKNPLDNTYGMLVFSRLMLVDTEIRFLLKDSIPSMHMRVVLRSGDPVYLHFVHPDPPNPVFATETTERDAELLIVGREVEKRGKPTIVAGDFNDVAWSHTTSLFQKTSGLLDPRVGRGMYNTFNARNPLLRWPLDHVFHSDHFRLVRMERGPAWGSDHFPVFIQLNLEAGAEAEQEEPDTSPAESRQVEEKIEEGRQEA
ncbi:endonuclease/exonuclease/phosphatase family protein [Marinobacter sp.]|uniref:endonuclease/exonuclease/phosphatase family protein n=1 Tax=Marinobacter sp. TaxID=50741 RepID=UPI00356B12D1